MIRSILFLFASAIPLFAQSADDEKFRRPFGPYQTPGLLSPRLVDESTVDREAILREQLPSEYFLERQQELVRRTILAMQGVWRVETFMLDGTVLRPEEFAGLKYRIQDTVMVQSETSTQWLRPVAFPTAPSKLQTNLENARRQRREPGSLDTILRETVEEKPEWLVPAHVARPTGMSIRNDPKDEEGVRLLMLHRGNGQAFMYSWDR